MVVAGEAGEAVVVVKPLGLTVLAALDIAYGTDAGATSALDAAIGNDMKGLVGDEETLKEAPHGTREEPWDRTACERAKESSRRLQSHRAMVSTRASSWLAASSFFFCSLAGVSTSMKGSPT